MQSQLLFIFPPITMDIFTRSYPTGALYRPTTVFISNMTFLPLLLDHTQKHASMLWCLLVSYRGGAGRGGE